MEIKTDKHANYISVVPVGDIDANSSIFLDQKLGELLEAGESNFHVSCAEVPYISSAGCGVFISKLDEVSEKSGKLVISNMKENVYEAFHLLGLHQLIPIFDNEVDVEKFFSQE